MAISIFLDGGGLSGHKRVTKKTTHKAAFGFWGVLKKFAEKRQGSGVKNTFRK